ncbi:MAG: PilZ domain-containing protein [Planctomycetes bacterium]|nr:PilZ domain-containing protein [Planctomycetota bacterium]
MSGPQAKRDRLLCDLERRQHFRLECGVDASFQLVDSDEPRPARVSKLGLGGARVDFPIELPIPCHLTLHLPARNTEDGKVRALSLPCRVAWTTAQEDALVHPTGVQFQALSLAQKNGLVEYLMTFHL